MSDAQLHSPRLTTALGGCGIILAMVLPVVQSFPNALPALFFAMAANPAAQFLPPTLLAVSFAVLALGVEGERGIAHQSVLGTIGLIVFGCHRLVLSLTSAATTTPGASVTASATVGTSVTVLAILAGAIGAAAIARSGVLTGFARWALIPVIVANALTLALLSVPVQEIAVVSAHVNTAGLLLFAIAGASYALHGRGTAIRRRLAIINEQW